MYSKSGCRTCKIRKVKCDEAYPACRRCLSTGRTCDGYGIWTRNSQQMRPRPLMKLNAGNAIPKSILGPILATTALEEQCLEWFKVRTVTKLPGTFNSGFWSKLLLQVTLDEPAILHASVALAAYHKADIVHHDAQGRAQIEQLALHNYAKAIKCLQPCFLNKDRSVQVILIACIVFASLECLRGHFVSAQMHVQNGLNILRESQDDSEADKYSGMAEEIIRRSSVVDDWIFETLSRLNLQNTLMRPSWSGFFFQTQTCSTIPRRFCSLKASWNSLDYLINRILWLMQSCNEHKRAKPQLLFHPHLLKLRQQALANLRRWHKANGCSIADILQGVSCVNGGKVVAILETYHTMAAIMAELCLCSGDEMAFDSQVKRFSHMVNHLESLFNVSRVGFETHTSQIILVSNVNMTSTIMDLGCLVPLYYVATKCRFRSLRHRAVALLDTVFHREGLWDSRITALVARKVVELEEGQVYHDGESETQHSCKGSGGCETKDVPDISESQRIGAVEVKLSGNPVEKIQLWGCQHFNMGSRRCLAEYDVGARVWQEA